MADFQITGRIEGFRYSEACIIVIISEYKNGYKKSDGTIVNEKYITWACIFKAYFKKFISEHFAKGQLVQIKGEIFPYALKDEVRSDGYTVLGQTINIASLPKNLKKEMKMIKDSQSHSLGSPNLDDYKTLDF